jgi:hypothetical protein
LAIGGGGHIQLLQKAYEQWNIEDMNFVRNIDRRGVEDLPKVFNLDHSEIKVTFFFSKVLL